MAELRESDDGEVGFYVWEVADGEALPLAGFDVFATVVGEPVDGGEAEEESGDGDAFDGDAVDEDGIYVAYADLGPAPALAFELVPLQDEAVADDKATATTSTNGLRLNFQGFGYKSIKSQRTAGTGNVTSTFYNQTSSTSSWTTLYGPTTYSTCTYAYNCAGPYGMGVLTSWSSGTRTMTYTMTTSCSVTC